MNLSLFGIVLFDFPKVIELSLPQRDSPSKKDAPLLYVGNDREETKQPSRIRFRCFEFHAQAINAAVYEVLAKKTN